MKQKCWVGTEGHIVSMENYYPACILGAAEPLLFWIKQIFPVLRQWLQQQIVVVRRLHMELRPEDD